MQILNYLSDATVVFFFANMLYVISYTLTSMIWLRLLAIIAAASTMPYFYLQAEPLWSALFWQSCFFTVNLVNLLILLYSMRSIQFDDDEEIAYRLKFSALQPYELRPIFKCAERLTLSDGDRLLSEDAENRNLYLILDGQCRVLHRQTEVAVLGPGHFVGELSFLSGERVSADVVAAGPVRLLAWDRETLQPLFKRRGLYESYFHSLCGLDVAGKLRSMTTGRSASAAFE